MSLKGVWVIPLLSNEEDETKAHFSRLYQTNIKKCQQLEGDDYVPLPSNPEFVKALLFELGQAKYSQSKFLPARDSCRRIDQRPVFEISTSKGKLWPVVIVEQNGCLHCCLPFVPQGAHASPPLIDIPGVTLGFTLMCAMADFLRTTPASEVMQKSSDLYSFLSHAAPFGTMLDTTLESVIVKMNNKPYFTPKTLKQPAWKPMIHKGKNQIFLSINEYIRAVQYDKDNIDDVWDVYGTISCKAELEGTMPTVTITISQAGDGEVTPLHHLVIHPCVQSADSHVVEDDSGRTFPRRVRFTPSLEKITLCHYTFCSTHILPIQGSFEMFVEETRVKINVRLKLNVNARNQFEYCELQIPFVSKGPVSIQESSQNHGSLLISPDKAVVVWNIGQRFPARFPEINMSAIVQLGDGSTTKPGTLEEQFCVGQNAYAQLFFKMADYTNSGCHIDPKSIQVSPNMKYKLTTVREFQSMEYKIWNVHGDCLMSTVPRCLYDHTKQDIHI